MFQDVCAFVGAIVLDFCRAAGRMMLLFLDTLSKLREVNIKEMLRQMALLGAEYRYGILCADGERIC